MDLQTSSPSSSCRVTPGTVVGGLPGPVWARGEIVGILVPSIFIKHLCIMCPCARFWGPDGLLGRARDTQSE